MKAKLISCVAVLLGAGSAGAAERAVESIHPQVDLTFDFFAIDDKEYYDEDAVSIAETLRGEITVPVGPYLGVSAGASFTKSNQESTNDNNDFEFEDDTIRGAAQLFYRNPSIGRVAFGYARERTEYESTYNGYRSDGTDTSYSYLALVEGYLGPVTIALRDERIFNDYSFNGINSRFHADIAWASVQWYAVPRVCVGLEVGFKEAKDGYRAEIEFQPTFLGNMAGIYVGYVRADDDQTEVNGVRLGVNFYFNKRFDLKTRDRHYR